MTGHNTAVFGVFKIPSRANRAVSRLTSAGFSNCEVSLLESNLDTLLSEMGISRDKAKRYEGYVKEGSIFLSVNCSNSLEIDRANIILKQNGAEHISSIATGEQVVSTHEVHQP